MTEVTSGVMLQLKHIRQARLCSKGTRAWFRHHGFDWTTFLKDGLPVEMFEATGDKLALDVAKIARADHG